MQLADECHAYIEISNSAFILMAKNAIERLLKFRLGSVAVVFLFVFYLVDSFKSNFYMSAIFLLNTFFSPKLKSISFQSIHKTHSYELFYLNTHTLTHSHTHMPTKNPFAWRITAFNATLFSDLHI